MPFFSENKKIEFLIQLITELPLEERVSFALIGQKFGWNEVQTEIFLRKIIQMHPKLGHLNSFKKEFIRSSLKTDKPKSYTYSEVRKKYPNAFKKWTAQEDKELVAKYKEGIKIDKLAKYFQRSRKAIWIRLENFGLIH